MARLFFSYCHKDEDLRDRLEVHLAMLKRSKAIETWHDRRIYAGEEWKGVIDEELERAEVILLLVSPDFLNSNYCFEIEMQRALQRHESGDATVIPVILKPCDWKNAPFQKLQAAPKDGKPLTQWNDLDTALLDVVEMVRNALSKTTKEISASSSQLRGAEERQGNSRSTTATVPEQTTDGETVSSELNSPRSSNLRLKKEFSDIEKDNFLEEGFDYMSRFFKNSLSELEARNSGINAKFRQIDANRFVASIYKDGKSIAACKVTIGKDFSQRQIKFSNNERIDDNSYNESLCAKADNQSIYLEASGMPQLEVTRQTKLTHEGASEYFWQLLVRYLQ